MKSIYDIKLNVKFCSIWTTWCSWMSGDDFTQCQPTGLRGEHSKINYFVIVKKQMRMMCDDRHCYAKVFKGEMTHITNCSEGHTINEETNPFWTLPLSLTDTPDTTYSVVSRQRSEFLFSILMWCDVFWSNLKFIATFLFSQQNSFETIFQTKTYTADNMVYCNECKKKTEAKSVGLTSN